MNNLTPISFTLNAVEHLKEVAKHATGRDLTDQQVTAYFNEINYWQPDGSAHIEFGSHETLDGNPKIADFDADDFIYA